MKMIEILLYDLTEWARIEEKERQHRAAQVYRVTDQIDAGRSRDSTWRRESIVKQHRAMRVYREIEQGRLRDSTDLTKGKW